MSANVVLGSVLSGLVGLLLGAGANILADDLPERETPRQPHCPHCGHPRRAHAWFGIGAFATSQRRCENCHERLSWRHPLLELTLAIAFAFLWNRYGTSSDGFFIAIYVWLAALVMVVDIEHKLILNVVMAPAIWVALAEAALSDRLPFLTAVRGGAIGFGFVFGLYLFGEVFRQITARLRGESVDIAFGYGDVTLATFGGLVVGNGSGGVALMLTLMIVVGGVVAAGYVFYERVIQRDYSLFAAIPYGPNIIFGMLVALIWPTVIGDFLRDTFF